MQDGRISVILVDDAPEVRMAVRARLHVTGRFEVVGEAANGADAAALAGRLRPDLLLLDASMPGCDGLDALPLIVAASPATKVLMLSGFESAALAASALSRGAAGYVEKGAPLAELPDRLLGLFPDVPPADPSGADHPDRDFHENAIRQHVEQFRAVFDQAAIGMATVTLAGTVVRVNSALAEMLDLPAGDIVGRHYPALVDELDGTGLTGAIAEVGRGERDLAEIEHRLPRLSDSAWAKSTIAAVRGGDGRPLYLLAQLQDVTESRRALEALRQSEERFRLLVAQVRDYAIFMLDPDGHIATWNLGAQRMKGYSAAEIIGQHFRVFYPPEVQAARHPEHELEIATREGRYEEEGWRVRKDGTRFWANVVITAVRDGSGELAGYAKVTRDLTEWGRAHARLEASEERFRLLVEQVRDYAIFMLDSAGRVATWNTGAERMKGYMASEIIGRHFRTFYPPEVARSGHPEHELEIAAREGRYEGEGWRVRKDGTRFWANVVITALFGDDGRLAGFAKVTRDVSERRAATEARELAAAELAAANQDLRDAAQQTADFLAALAHELRSPIAVLSSGAALLRDHWEDLDDAGRQEIVDSISLGSSRLARLLDDLLLAARLEAGSFEFHLERFRAADVLGDALGALPALSAEVEVSGPTDLEVLADRLRVVQILSNLLSNGAKHGRLPIRVELAVAGEVLLWRVTDDGGGVSPDLEPRLFDRFSQGPGRGRHGTGLGLFIVRELARGQGGDAWYEGETGSFVFSVPLA